MFMYSVTYPARPSSGNAYVTEAALPLPICPESLPQVTVQSKYLPANQGKHLPTTYPPRVC